jgi:predicted nucleic acid-binding protein
VIRAVIDTNVLFEGLTKLGPAASVVDAWAQKLFQPCVSTALALEYQEVLERKLAVHRVAAQKLGFRMVSPVDFLSWLNKKGRL